MILFFTNGFEPDTAEEIDSISRYMTDRLGQPCVVVPGWVCGAVAIGSDGAEPVQVLYSGKPPEDCRYQLRQIAEELREQGRQNRSEGHTDQGYSRFMNTGFPIICALLGSIIGALFTLL